jgi:hypothetical protein
MCIYCADYRCNVSFECSKSLYAFNTRILTQILKAEIRANSTLI